MRTLVAGVVLASLVVFSAVVRAQAADVFTKKMLQPQGKYYEATVPDTLDLAERAKLSVRGLTSFLDATSDYAPWGHFAVDNARPALLDRAGGWPNWGKIAEATLKMRYMCGSTEGVDNQLASLRGMIAKLPPSTVPNHGFVLTLGLFYFVMNGLLLLVFSWFMPAYQVHGLWAGILGSLVVMVVNWLIWAVLGPSKE